MSEPKHSPGPWAVAGGYIADASGSRAVARFVPPEDTVVNWAGETADHLTLANGRLLAAAPELLAVAEQAAAVFNHLSGCASTKEAREEFSRREAAARAVIAKVNPPWANTSRLPDPAPPLLVAAEDWPDFCEWIHEGGHNQRDSEDEALQRQYLDERSASRNKGGPQP